MNTWILVLIAIVVALTVMLVEHHMNIFKIETVRKYITLYCWVINHTLSEQKQDKEETHKFFIYWNKWIAYAAFFDAAKESKNKGNCQDIAWRCILYAVEDLKDTLSINSTYLNHMQQYDQSPWRIQELKEWIESLINCPEYGVTINYSYKSVIDKYHIPQYEISK